jgi:hypothetical protein
MMLSSIWVICRAFVRMLPAMRIARPQKVSANMAVQFMHVKRFARSVRYTLSLSVTGQLIPGLLSAATLFEGNLLTDVSVSSVGKVVNAGGGDYIFTQANTQANVDPIPGFSVQTPSGVRYATANGATMSPGVTVQSLVFSGDTIELGIPGELGTLTVQAGNTLADVTTARTYSRPVVFTQLAGDVADQGAAVVPTAPLMEGNTFSFSVEAATGSTPDLEGATLLYFIAEEGWHRLSDGRMLLVSSIELRDENYAGLTFNLGADFTDAATIAQLQRPALILNDDGSLTPKSGYQGVMLSGGQGAFSSLTMRFMADVAYEAEAAVRNFGARVGFMVLGDADMRSDSPLNYRAFYSSVHAYDVFGEGYFQNYRHSAAASPLFNKNACADDADLDGYCLHMSPPADLPSRNSIFEEPRLPYVSEKFQPLTLNMNKHGTFSASDWRWDVEDHHFLMTTWEDIIEEAAENPNNVRKFNLGECASADNCPVDGALSRAFPKYDADRWWDTDFLELAYGHWYNIRNYDACVQDDVSTACTDLSPEELFGAPIIDWETQTHSKAVHEADLIPGVLEELTPEQAVFTELDRSVAYGVDVFNTLIPDVNTAHRLADYLNFNIPDEITWLECGVQLPRTGHPDAMDELGRLQGFVNHYIQTLNLDPWQVMGIKLWFKATEVADVNGWTHSDQYYYGVYIPIPTSDGTWQFEDWGVDGGSARCMVPTNGRINSTGFSRHWVFDYMSSYSRTIKPLIAMMGEYVVFGDGIFSNYPYTSSETNLRWVRSSNKNHATAITAATGQAGYIATTDDENYYLSFCLDNSDSDSVCADDWVRVRAAPYIANITLRSSSDLIGDAYAVIGDEFIASLVIRNPSGDPFTSSAWWVVDVDGKYSAAPVETAAGPSDSKGRDRYARR